MITMGSHEGLKPRKIFLDNNKLNSDTITVINTYIVDINIKY